MNLHNHHLHIPQLGRARTVRILLPDTYDRQARPFPVIYALDGQNLFSRDTAFGRRHWKIPETMTKMPKRLQAIVVGIDNGGHERLDEYTPYRRGRHGGQGDAFVHFLMESLKPFVDHHYRTRREAEATAIVGSSLGGLLALYAGLQYGQVFGRVGVLSPATWFNPQVLRLAENHQGYKAHLYVAGSRKESRGMAPQLEAAYYALKKGGFSDAQLRIVVRDRGQHGEPYWSREFRHMHRWLFEGVK